MQDVCSFSDVMSRLIPGVQVHLESSVYSVRRLGMLTSEIVSELLNISQEKLTFEVSKYMT